MVVVPSGQDLANHPHHHKFFVHVRSEGMASPVFVKPSSGTVLSYLLQGATRYAKQETKRRVGEMVKCESRRSIFFSAEEANTII
jgi:hypothetical protein